MLKSAERVAAETGPDGIVIENDPTSRVRRERLRRNDGDRLSDGVERVPDDSVTVTVDVVLSVEVNGTPWQFCETAAASDLGKSVADAAWNFDGDHCVVLFVVVVVRVGAVDDTGDDDDDDDGTVERRSRAIGRVGE